MIRRRSVGPPPSSPPATAPQGDPAAPADPPATKSGGHAATGPKESASPSRSARGGGGADTTQPVAKAGARSKPERLEPTPPASRPAKPGARRIRCTWCGGEVEVGKSAQSLVCPHCNQRLVVEDFRTATYHAVRQVATCGDVFIDKRGHVVAAVKASNVTVVGRLEGNVSARGRVEIKATARVKGDIVAPALRVESGATLEGRVRIGVPETGDR